ncbi:unnamed protein product [Effrenium voratum]|nr:unnamed protein product [Effrenium voratum]CAJ1450416.1 unnamed protein product [Effrenium voratum]
MVTQLPLELTANVLLTLVADATKIRAFPRADEQLCRCGFKTCTPASCLKGCCYGRLASMMRTCTRSWRAILAGNLWGKAAGMVLWPPRLASSAETSRKSLARLLYASGSSCRYLRINCMALQPGELSWLSTCCPAVEMLQLCFFGPGTGMEWLKTWASTLRQLCIHFWYDDCLGPPPVLDAIQEILRSCTLDGLWLTGIDWPRARSQIAHAVQAALSRAALHCCHISLEGSQPWPEEELGAMRASGLKVKVNLLADRTR